MDLNAEEVARMAEIGYSITVKFIVISAVIVLLVDVWFALIDKVEGNSISQVVNHWAQGRLFVVAWIWGVLAGHFFLAREIPAIIAPYNMILLLLVTAGFIYFGWQGNIRYSMPWQIFLLVIGTAAGHFLWPIKLSEM